MRAPIQDRLEKIAITAGALIAGIALGVVLLAMPTPALGMVAVVFGIMVLAEGQQQGPDDRPLD